jgi:hypothetical protein
MDPTASRVFNDLALYYGFVHWSAKGLRPIQTFDFDLAIGFSGAQPNRDPRAHFAKQGAHCIRYDIEMELVAAMCDPTGRQKPTYRY